MKQTISSSSFNGKTVARQLLVSQLSSEQVAGLPELLRQLRHRPIEVFAARFDQEIEARAQDVHLRRRSFLRLLSNINRDSYLHGSIDARSCNVNRPIISSASWCNKIYIPIYQGKPIIHYDSTT